MHAIREPLEDLRSHTIRKNETPHSEIDCKGYQIRRK